MNAYGCSISRFGLLFRSVAWFGVLATGVASPLPPLDAAEPPTAQYQPAEPFDKDLTPYVKRSLRNFMVLNPQPVPDHPDLYRVRFGCFGMPPLIECCQWGWGDGTGRAVEAWIDARRLTGEREFGRAIEQGQRKLLLWLLTDKDGLSHVPELSHPEQGTYYYHLWDQGRVLRGLVRWWLVSEDPAEKELLARKIDKMLETCQHMAIHGVDGEGKPTAKFADGVGSLNNGRPDDLDSWCAMSAGQLIEPLAMYWPACGDPKIRAFTDALCNGVLAAGESSEPGNPPIKANWRFGEDGSFTDHFHAKVAIAVGIARQGVALYRHRETDRGLRLLRWAKKVYDWPLSPSNINRGSTWGWFPERAGVENPKAGEEVRTTMEICCTADMIELAAVLADAANLDASLVEYDRLWDHVERYVFGAVIPSQFVITKRYAELAAEHKGDLKIAEQLVGAWAGYHPPNDWMTAERSGVLEMCMGCCCNYSGVRALFACWERVFDDDGVHLTVRLPITADGSAAVQSVAEGPVDVRQVIRMAADRSLRVRVPDWAAIEQAAIEQVAAGGARGEKVLFTIRGRYLDCGRQARGSELVVTYPLQTRVTEERVGGDNIRGDYAPADTKPTYTVNWKGNRVVSMQPAGRWLPIFSDR